MRLPWRENSFGELKNRIQELEEELDELRDKRDSWRNRFEAEEKRRSKLASEKQKKDEKLKKLRQRLKSREESGGEDEEKTASFKQLEFEEAFDLLELLRSVKSTNENLVTVKARENVRELEDFKGLRNILDQEFLEKLYRLENFAAFSHSYAFRLVVRSRGFFEQDWQLSDSFSVKDLLDFVESRKTWVVISAGSTRIVEESSGEVLEARKIKSRVDRKHTQGGYSQSRFERKRDKQIEEHLEEVREKLPEDYLVLGNQQMASKLDGTYLGGYDDNRRLEDELYKFRVARFD